MTSSATPQRLCTQQAGLDVTTYTRTDPRLPPETVAAAIAVRGPAWRVHRRHRSRAEACRGIASTVRPDCEGRSGTRAPARTGGSRRRADRFRVVPRLESRGRRSGLSCCRAARSSPPPPSIRRVSRPCARAATCCSSTSVARGGRACSAAGRCAASCRHSFRAAAARPDRRVRPRVRAKGGRLRTAAAADDIEAVRAALGLERLDLWGRRTAGT